MSVCPPVHQNHALRLCLGAYRTSPASRHEANEPLDFRREKAYTAVFPKIKCNYNNPACVAVSNSKFHFVFERKPTQLPFLAIHVSGDLQTVGFKKSDVITSSIPTTPSWLLTRSAVNFTLHCLDKSNTPPKYSNIVFMNSVVSSRITIAYLLMTLEKTTELQLPWFVETILSVFDYDAASIFRA